jgi:hypothetical protein
VLRDRADRGEDPPPLVALRNLDPVPLFERHRELERIERIELEPVSGSGKGSCVT